jgi:hypothetical protein
MNTITPCMDRLESWKRKKMETKDVLEERGERSEDSPNQEVMMKTFSTSAMYTEERGVKAGHHYSSLLALLLTSEQTNKKEQHEMHGKSSSAKEKNATKDWVSANTTPHLKTADWFL